MIMILYDIYTRYNSISVLIEIFLSIEKKLLQNLLYCVYRFVIHIYESR